MSSSKEKYKGLNSLELETKDGKTIECAVLWKVSVVLWSWAVS